MRLLRSIPWHRLLPAHQRLALFWILAGLGLAAPWLGHGGNPWFPSVPPGRACQVDSVHDGDTLRATCDGRAVKVRLYCIDAPELAQRPWGQESRTYLRQLLPQPISLREHDTDRYGRIVGEVFGHAGKSLNLALVEAGQAAVYPRYCKESRFFDAEKRAKADRRGIWEKEGEQQRPWDYRQGQRR